MAHPACLGKAGGLLSEQGASDNYGSTAASRFADLPAGPGLQSFKSDGRAVATWENPDSASSSHPIDQGNRNVNDQF